MLGQFSNFTQKQRRLEKPATVHKGRLLCDIWRLSRRLTVNFGVRYEPYDISATTKDRNQTFDLRNYQKGIHSKIS